MLTSNHIQKTATTADAAEDITTSSQLGFNIEIELNNLAELIFNSTHIPLTDLYIVDRDLLLHQLDQIKENLPVDLATAIEIANCRQQIISEAEGYACLIVKSAEEKASQILQESAIVRQAELDGAKIRLKTERECEELKQATLTEIEQLRQSAIAQSRAIEIGADNYADDVLGDIEQRLQQMLEIIHNGRQQLERQ
ncbi:MAG TPA: hypothetical protein V6C71_26535 [Coleofasciculaceae cyanobacterium]|jgi:vacuolar-type H+-ATPase subunit H